MKKVRGQKSRSRARVGAITDVPGIRVGHAHDLVARTGCTVVLCGDEGAVAGVDVRGAAPGTRETDLLNPENLVERVHAVLLTGGSVFGLDAACGVVRWLEERRIGFDTERMIEAAPADSGHPFSVMQNTTLAVVATDAALSKAQARKVAAMAHDGLARAIKPIHTMVDGDTIFAVSTGTAQADVTIIGAV